MKVTLRKAHRLDKALRELANQPTKTYTTISGHAEFPEQKLAEATKSALDDIDLRILALRHSFTIRKALAGANSTAGINALLTDDAAAQAEIAVLQSIVNDYDGGHGGYRNTARVPYEDVVPRFQINQIRLTTGEVRAVDSMDVLIFDRSFVEQTKATISDLKRTRAKLADEIVEAGSKNTIVLPEEVEQFLVANKIV